MHTLFVRNVHAALPEGLRYLADYGKINDSRAGKVIVAPGPVMTVYSHPCERVLFWSDRDANPFFHLMESLWMLAGRNDVEWLVRFNQRMAQFSDDGKTFHGAYGYRWRYHFPVLGSEDGFQVRLKDMDQLEGVINLLKNHPHSRRAVISMWDPSVDLKDHERGKDHPCNTQIYLSPNSGSLDMTVMCRSNDLIWGAAGANAVHFSILQEYIASKLDLRVGTLYQFSNNYHAYLDIFDKNRPLIEEARDLFKPEPWNPYLEDPPVEAEPLITSPEAFDLELDLFMDQDDPYALFHIGMENPFLTYASVLKYSHNLWKNKKIDEAIDMIHQYCPPRFDFAVAAIQWLERRKNRTTSS